MNHQWKPIESAPKNQLVMVYTPPQPSDWPDTVRIGFDYIDPEVADDYWYNHGEHYEHYCCVAKPENCTGPQERAPYTHWMPLPAAPCQTCNDQGAVGNILNAEPCPDCSTPPASAQDDAKDAARWRFIRRKLCLTGNGDGTCGMHAINLPASIPGWPDPGAAVAEFCEAAIDAALSASQQQEG